MLVVFIVYFNYRKQTRPTKKIANNSCLELAYKKYAAAGEKLDIETLNIPPLQSTTGQLVKKRHLEERFCLEWVACAPPNSEFKAFPVLESDAFAQCLKDEEKQDDSENGGDNNIEQE